MRILLINPSTSGMLVGNNPAFLDELRGCNPPLNLMYLARVLDGYVSVHDEQVDELLDWKLSFGNFDVVGITATTFVLLRLKELIKKVRRLAPKARLVVGGAHATLYPKETLGLGVDTVITGESEGNINEIIMERGIQRGKKADIDRIFPLRSNVMSYNSIFSDGIATILVTSRGCPFRCSFCMRGRGGDFRSRSPESVLKELGRAVDQGISNFMFYDDTFTVDRERVIKICKMILEKKLKIAFDVRTRVDRVDEEMLKMLKRAGMVQIHMGIESGVQRILDRLNKGIKLAQIEKAFSLCRRLRIRTLGYVMIGNPDENTKDMDETERFVLALAPDYLHATIYTPFPGTDLYDEWVGQRGFDPWQEFAMDPFVSFQPPVWDGWSRQVLDNRLMQMYKRFYLRPSYIMKRALGIRSTETLKKYFTAWLRMRGGNK